MIAIFEVAAGQTYRALDPRHPERIRVYEIDGHRALVGDPDTRRRQRWISVRLLHARPRTVHGRPHTTGYLKENP